MTMFNDVESRIPMTNEEIIRSISWRHQVLVSAITELTELSCWLSLTDSGASKETQDAARSVHRYAALVTQYVAVLSDSIQPLAATLTPPAPLPPPFFPIREDAATPA